MNEDRLSLAFGRLERAVSRLETQLPQPPSAPAPHPDEPASRAKIVDLEERHEALRRQATAAVERLDRLLDDSGKD